MLGATLYMVGVDAKSGELLRDTNSCMMCKRMVINAGIATVIIRTGEDSYKTINVEDWICDDDQPLGGVRLLMAISSPQRKIQNERAKLLYYCSCR